MESYWSPSRPRHGGQSLPKLCCRVLGSVGLPLDSGTDLVPSPPLKAGETLVDHQKTGEQAISANTWRPSSGLNWREIFERYPNLSPPGYEEAVESTLKLVELRKLKQREATNKTTAPRSTLAKPRKTSRRKK